MKLKNIKFILPYLYFVVVVGLSFYGFKYWIPFAWTVSILIGFLIPIATCFSFFYSKQFLWLLLYSIIVAINYLSGDAYFKSPPIMVKNFCDMFISLSMAYYVYTHREYNLMHYIIIAAFSVLVFTAISSFILDLRFPGVVRTAGSIIMHKNTADISSFNVLYRFGLSDYLSPHAIPIIIPPLVMGVKYGESFKKRMLLLLCLFASLLLIYLSGATGPLIVGIMILLLSVIVQKGRNLKNIIRVIVVLSIFTPFLLNQNLMLGGLQMADELMGNNSHFHEKIMDFQDVVKYGESEGDVSARQDFYSLTIETIGENPLLGTDEEHGGHSALLDRFASLGLLGFLPLVFLLFSQYNYIIKYIANENRIFYYLGIIAAAMMLLSKKCCLLANLVLPLYCFAVLYLSICKKNIRQVT